MDRELTLRRSRCGAGYFFDGVSYGTQPLTVEAKTESHIVLHAPGHSWNGSGIRGMPMPQYAPAMLIACRIIRSNEDGSSMVVERLIHWRPSEAAAQRAKAKAMRGKQR